MKLALQLIIFVCTALTLQSQHIEVLTRAVSSSIRGLSVVDDRVVWVSGSNGKVGRSVDAGKTWKWMLVKNFEKRDFRDIEAFDDHTAIIMAIASPAAILKTTDAGETWKTVYENGASGMFLDAMEFSGDRTGIAIGDPIQGKFFIARTNDYGNSWTEVSVNDRPVADSGEACFASSGTNIRLFNKEDFGFVSGGLTSRYLSSRSITQLPIIQGSASTGANSIAIWKASGKNKVPYLVVVGGDFTKDTVRTSNCYISNNGGKTWTAPKSAPGGYRSCVEFIDREHLITCGTSGVDISIDSGMNWKPISKESFHVCRKAKKGSMVFLAGSGGKIGKLVAGY